MTSQEFDAIKEMLFLLVLDWRVGFLLLLLLFSCYSDIRFRKISNKLVLFGLAYALIFNSFFLHLAGLGYKAALLGMVLGFALLLPFYLLRVMGAGDVKLMAMIGAFVGSDIFGVILYSLIAGGVLSLLYILVRGRVWVYCANLSRLFKLNYLNIATGQKTDFRIDASQSAGKLPFAVAITTGTTAYLVLTTFGLVPRI